MENKMTRRGAPNGLCFNISQDAAAERWRKRVHVLDADGFKLLPLFSIRHEAFTSLIFQTTCRGLMFRVNELSVHPSPSTPPPPCIHLLLRLEMLLHGLREPELLRRLPTLLLCTPRCLWGCNYQSSHAIQVSHAYDPLCFSTFCFDALFFPQRH